VDRAQEVARPGLERAGDRLTLKVSPATTGTSILVSGIANVWSMSSSFKIYALRRARREAVGGEGAERDLDRECRALAREVLAVLARGRPGGPVAPALERVAPVVPVEAVVPPPASDERPASASVDSPSNTNTRLRMPPPRMVRQR
jgi:hypothetical protein